MKEQKLHQGHFGKKPQKLSKVVNTAKQGTLRKFHMLRKLHAKILHVAKIVCENFATSKILCNFDSPFVFSSNFYLLCPCSFELGSGFSHLNWLEESGTIGLQNYKKYSQNMISSIVETLVYQFGYLS